MASDSRRSNVAGGVLTLAVGNATTSALLWSPRGAVRARRQWATRGDPRTVRRAFLDFAIQTKCAAIVLAGVVPDVVAAVSQSAIANRISAISLRFRRNLPCPLTIRPRPAAKVGDDRLAAALGALAIDPRVPWVVVDAGTALTVNAVRPATRSRKARGAARRVQGVFEGGLIVPGERLCLQALGGGTAQLPALKPLAPTTKARVWGRSTEEAIRFGVRRAQLAAVLALARAQAGILGAGTRIVLTGGGAEALWPAFRRALARHRPVRDPDLVHRGLLAAFDLTRM